MDHGRRGIQVLGLVRGQSLKVSTLPRLPFFYGWVIVAVAFVTMGLGVNARTAFSLLFPPILDEFGWERGLTAGAFSFGFLVSAVLSPFVGRLMDRHGPRVVIEMGVGLIAAGLMLAPLVRQPWHLYATLGVLVVSGANCLGYTGQSLFLPNWFVRRRGLATSMAFCGVGVGSILVLPWLQGLIGRAGWRTACWALGIAVPALLAPLNLLLKRRPEDLGLAPDGDRPLRTSAAADPTANVVDAAWVAVDWTLGRTMRTARFWWIAGYLCGLFAWYVVQIHQTKYLVDIGVSSTHAAWALGFVSLAGIPGQIALGYVSDRIGREWVWTIGSLGFGLCFLALLGLYHGPPPMLLEFTGRVGIRGERRALDLMSPAIVPAGRGRATSPCRPAPVDDRPPAPSVACRPGRPRRWSARPHCGPRRGRHRRG
jgi:MFS family permease